MCVRTPRSLLCNSAPSLVLQFPILTSRSKTRMNSSLKMDDSTWSAYLDVKTGSTIREAAAKHGVTFDTLRRRMISIIPRPVGRPAAFSPYDEFILASLLRGFNMFQTPLTSEKCLECFRTLAKKRGMFKIICQPKFFNHL